jgi:hypothetical protein
MPDVRAMYDTFQCESNELGVASPCSSDRMRTTS